MKKYKLYTERIVTDETEFELPDDFDLKEFLDEEYYDQIKNIEGYNEIEFYPQVDSYDNEWFSVINEDDEVIAEY